MEVNCVPFKFKVGNQEFEAFMTENTYRQACDAMFAEQKRTGYERVPVGASYWYVAGHGSVERDEESACCINDYYYETANYYSSQTVAENNARADKLMRNLRRFSVENATNELDWSDPTAQKWTIFYDHRPDFGLSVWSLTVRHDFMGIYFDSKVAAEAALKTFYDELIWYFTEYKNSLRGG